MTLLLQVLSGARAGHVLETDEDLVRIGREEGSALRFDPERDLDVSARHASVAREEGAWVLRDLGSRNGTFLNGERVDVPTPLRDGDRIRCGADGPEVQVHLLEAGGTQPFLDAGLAVSAGSRGRRSTAAATREGPSLAAARVVRRWRTAAAALGLLLVAAAAVLLLGGRERMDSERERAVMLARIDSAVAAGEAALTEVEGELSGLAASLREAQRQLRETEAALRDGSSFDGADSFAAVRVRLDSALATLERQRLAAELDHEAIRNRNGRAVGRLYVEYDGGDVAAGTAFAVRPDATLVTSRHLLESADGAPARRLAVQFSYSDQVWPARLLVADEELDLAVIKVDGILGTVPTVQGLNLRSDTVPTGAPVQVLGYPLGGDITPSDRPGRTVISPISGAGTVTSVAADRLEVDGYGARGSSGSPIFDGNGEVIAVVFGGREDGGTHYLVAVPAGAAVRMLLAASGDAGSR